MNKMNISIQFYLSTNINGQLFFLMNSTKTIIFALLLTHKIEQVWAKQAKKV